MDILDHPLEICHVEGVCVMVTLIDAIVKQEGVSIVKITLVENIVKTVLAVTMEMPQTVVFVIVSDGISL